MPIIADTDSKEGIATPETAMEIAREYPQWVMFAFDPARSDLCHVCDGSEHYAPTPNGLVARIALLRYELERAEWLLKNGWLEMPSQSPA